MKAKLIPVVSLLILLGTTLRLAWLLWEILEVKVFYPSLGPVGADWLSDRFFSARIVFYGAMIFRRMLWRHPVSPVIWALALELAIGLASYFIFLFPIHFAVLLVLFILDGRHLFRAWSPGRRIAPPGLDFARDA